MQPMSKTLLTVCFAMMFLVVGVACAAPTRLPDGDCPDVKKRHEQLHVSPLRLQALSACYDIHVPAGSVAVINVETTHGTPRPQTSVLHYFQGLVKQENSGADQRMVFGELTEDGWYQVQLRHSGLSGEVKLHLYRVDVTSAVMRGALNGLGMAFVEEGLNWILCQAMGAPCGESSGGQGSSEMVSRGVTLAVSTLQQRSLGQVTRDMAFNEAGIYVRHHLGNAGGHMMTIIMAVASEVIDSIYAH